MESSKQSQSSLLLLLLLLLPCDLLLNILSRLHYKQIVKLRCVCNFLLNLTTKDPRFIDHFYPFFIDEILNPNLCSDYHRKFHIFSTRKQSSFIYSERRQQLTPFKNPSPNQRFIGSCNGFLCFGGGNGSIEIYSIVAPAVRFSVPPCSDNVVTDMFNACYGFGYNPITEDYNVVCFIDCVHWNVFSIRSREWRYVGGSGAGVPPLNHDELWCTLSGSCICTMSGVICWTPSENCMGDIVTFNLDTMRFRVIRRPGKDLDFHMVYQGHLGLGYLRKSTRGSKVVLYSKYEEMNGYSAETFLIEFSPREVNQIVSIDDQIYLLRFQGKHAKLFNVKTQCWKDLELSSDHYLKSKIGSGGKANKPELKTIHL